MKVHVLQAVVEFENEVGATSSDKYIQVGNDNKTFIVLPCLPVLAFYVF